MISLSLRKTYSSSKIVLGKNVFLVFTRFMSNTNTTSNIPNFFYVAGHRTGVSGNANGAGSWCLDMLDREIARLSCSNPNLPMAVRLQQEADHRFCKAHREARRLGHLPRRG